ncbi:SprT-like domain-containing protein [Haloglomus salinum]|uniref:SprT-like domain-containing protein n=1 Tax=Haloglomus salinum TaxID=2962673 RepID=UPI0020C9770F|nr:SprT-like domain-containing protein [Haloglomus salinum]
MTPGDDAAPDATERAAADDGDSRIDPAYYAVDTDASEAEFLAACKLYAREVVDAFGLSADVGRLDWQVSRRAKRRAGQVRYRDDEPEVVVLTWGYFERRGWAAMASTVRHELVHVHLLNEYGDGSHGERFERWAERLDTCVSCELFTTPEWWVVCEDCDAALARYRESKLVRRVDEYRCGECGGDLRLADGDTRVEAGDE